MPLLNEPMQENPIPIFLWSGALSHHCCFTMDWSSDSHVDFPSPCMAKEQRKRGRSWGQKRPRRSEANRRSSSTSTEVRLRNDCFHVKRIVSISSWVTLLLRIDHLLTVIQKRARNGNEMDWVALIHFCRGWRNLALPKKACDGTVANEFASKHRRKENQWSRELNVSVS